MATVFSTRRAGDKRKEANMKAKTLASLLYIPLLAVVSFAQSTSTQVMGTVRAISANAITVETMGNAPKPVAIALLPTTKLIKDGAATTTKDLKVGDRVVVTVKPNGDKLEAVNIVFGKLFDHMDMHHQ